MNGDNEFVPIPIPESPESDWIVDPITEEDASVIYGLYTKLEDYQIYYHRIQNRYKRMSFTWVLASFIGTSILLAGKETEGAWPSLLILAFLTGLTACGIFLLGFYDNGICHRLLSAIFRGLKKLEKDYPQVFLEKPHIYQEEIIHGKKDPVIYHSSFYSCFISIFLLISTGSLVFYFIDERNTLAAWLTGILGPCFIICFFLWFQSFSKKSGVTKFHLFRRRKKK